MLLGQTQVGDIVQHQQDQLPSLTDPFNGYEAGLITAQRGIKL